MSKDSPSCEIGLPWKMLEDISWEAGDNIEISVDYEEGSIILRKVE